MRKKTEAPDGEAALRREAETILSGRDALPPPEARPDAHRLLHELQVHQIELEMQNEELRRTQLDLELSRQRYFDLYDRAPVGYFTLGENGLIQEANLTAADMLGMDRATLCAQQFSRLILPEDQDIFYLCRKALLDTGRPQSCELRLVARDAALLWVRLEATLAHDSGCAPLLRVVASDISSRKRAEKFQTDVERIIRHDIKTPLCNLHGLAQVVLDGTLSDDYRPLIPELLQAIRQVINLVDSSDKLLLMEQGQYSPQSAWFDLRDVLRTVERSLGSLTKARQVRLVQECLAGCDAQPDRPLFFGEEFLIEDMLLNLVKNAVEASPTDSAVTISCSLERDEQRIDIHNPGVVPEAIRERFFEKYATVGKSHGTGLGTHSAQLIARAHGGSIAFTTSEAQGTTLRVQLPCNDGR